MKKILKSILIATASIGTIAGSTAAVVSCGSDKSIDWTKQNPSSLTDQGVYEQEAKGVLSSLATYSLTKPLTLHVSDNTRPKAKKVIATYVNSIITSYFTWQRTRIGVINDADVSITGDVPSTATTTTAATHDIQITIPTTATQVSVKPFTYSFKIEVLAAVGQYQGIYNGAFEDILSGVPPSTSSLFNWSATLPVSGTTPPPASDHWLGGVGFETYTPIQFAQKFFTLDFPKFVNAAAPAFSTKLQNHNYILGQAKGSILFFGADGQPLKTQQINLSKAGTYYFQLEMQYAGASGYDITTLHSIVYATTITITAS